ncbi:hypothetical protein [Rheinheimera tilapiae]|uniref:Uncharacterized protein n=1 Tax=Rheinheimera tilapiae TaxID=875043 RepID=A0ABV6BC84_9GAMM
MTNLVSYFRKTEATTLLEMHFKPLTVSPNFAQVSFLHQIHETECGGDNLAEHPFACILTDHETGHSVLLSRTEENHIVFHGFFDDSEQAYDFACDHFMAEFHQSQFAALAVAADETGAAQ